MVSGISSGAGSAGSSGGIASAIVSPTLTRCPGSRIVAPSIATAPARIRAFRRERERPGCCCCARTRSSRPPFSAAVTYNIWCRTRSVMNSATDKSSLDRTLGAGKPVDPATRLSELLAQSLEELTRPFDPPRPAALRAAGEVTYAEASSHEPTPEPTPEESRLDADKALAELEAELFAAAKQVDRDAPADSDEPAPDHAETP